MAMSLMSTKPPANGPPDAERRARLLGAVAEAVVHRAALRVGEDLVARVDLLEAERGVRVVLVLVGVVLRGEPPEGALDLLLARRLGALRGPRSGPDRRPALLLTPIALERGD